jgi:hypothetical protein
MSTATVETLTADVRVLMVGSRQVTLSVYRQLDSVAPRDFEVFGRVRAKAFKDDVVELVGRRKSTGELCRCGVPMRYAASLHEEYRQLYEWACSFPLIVLAGLR